MEGKEGDLMFIPFGSFILLRCDVVHSGMCSGVGNLSLHCKLLSTPVSDEEKVVLAMSGQEWVKYVKENNLKVCYDKAKDIFAEEIVMDNILKLKSTFLNNFSIDKNQLDALPGEQDMNE